MAVKSISSPAVSVIVPIYNREKYVARCIESILRQTFLDIELILVDDGSKDGSLAICEKYAKKDGRIVVLHKENGGVSSACNLGLENCVRLAFLYKRDRPQRTHSCIYWCNCCWLWYYRNQ